MRRESLRSPLRLRRLMKVGACCGAAVIVLSSVLDHAGAFVRSADRGRQLDRQRVIVLAAVDGDTVRVKTPSGDDVTIGLLGVDAPRLEDHWAERALAYTKARLVNREVTLRVEPTQSTDDRGRVLAHVYVTDADLMNADIIRDGQAYADRRVRHPLAKQFEQLETEPRKKQRGLWKDLTFDQMPRWRREWLNRWREEHQGE